MAYSFSSSGGNIVSSDENQSIRVSGNRPSSYPTAKYVHFYTRANNGELKFKATGKFNSSGYVSTYLSFTFYFGVTYTVNLYAWHSKSSTPPSDPSLSNVQDTLVITNWPTNENVTMELTRLGATSVNVAITAGESRRYDRRYTITQNGIYAGAITIPAYTPMGRLVVEGITEGTYTFEASYNNGYSDGSGSATLTIYPTTDSGSYSYTANLTSVRLNLTNITSRSYSRTVYYYWENTKTGNSGEKNQVLSAGKTTDYRDMLNLTTDTQYKFRIYVTNPDGIITYDTGYFYVTTLSYDYELSMALSSTYNSITVTVTLNKTLSYDIDLTVQLNGSRDLDISISAGSITRSRTWTSNITAATVYTVKLIDNTRNKTFTSKKRTKNNFHWSTNVSAGLKFDLKASDWNELTNQLSSKCAYFSVTVNSFTSATKGKRLTADMYNQVARAINALVGKGDCVTSVPSVSKGGPIMADSLQLLANCLNE